MAFWGPSAPPDFIHKMYVCIFQGGSSPLTLWPRWSLRFQVSQACGCRQAWAVTHWAVPTIIPSSTEGKLRHGLLGLVAVSPVERVARMPALSGAWFLSGCSLHHEAREGQLSPFLVFCKLLHRETPPPQSACTSQPPRAREAWCVRSPASPEPHLPQIPCYR